MSVTTDTGFEHPEKFTRIDSDDLYAKALETFPVFCFDILILDKKGNAYPMPRKAKPLSGFDWFLGGRVFAGESPEQTMARTLKREAGLDIADMSRFILHGVHNYYFNDSAHGPQNHSMAFTYSIVLSDKELRSITLDRKEYDEKKKIKAVALADVRDGARYHQAVRDIAGDILAGGENSDIPFRTYDEEGYRPLRRREVLTDTEYKELAASFTVVRIEANKGTLSVGARLYAGDDPREVAAQALRGVGVDVTPDQLTLSKLERHFRNTTSVSEDHGRDEFVLTYTA